MDQVTSVVVKGGGNIPTQDQVYRAFIRDQFKTLSGVAPYNTTSLDGLSKFASMFNPIGSARAEELQPQDTAAEAYDRAAKDFVYADKQEDRQKFVDKYGKDEAIDVLDRRIDEMKDANPNSGGGRFRQELQDYKGLPRREAWVLMPFFPEGQDPLDTPNVNPTGRMPTGSESPDAFSYPTTAQTIGAAFRQNNPVVSALDAITRSRPDMTPVPGSEASLP